METTTAPAAAKTATITLHSGTLQVLPVGIIGLNGVSVAASGAKR